MRRALLVIALCSCVGNVGNTGGEGGGAAGGSAGGDSGGGSGGSSGGAAGGTAGGTAGSGGGATAGGSGGGGGMGGSGGGTMTDGGTCTAKFCDNFESFTAGAAPGTPWTVNKSAGATVTVDTTRVHGGTKSIHVTTDGNNAYRQAYFAVGAPFFPVTGNAFYGRAWFYVTAVPPMTTHWTNISAEGQVPDAGMNVRAYARYGGQVMKHLMANYDTSGGGVQTDCWQHSTRAMPEGTWNCYEWHYDQPNNRMELWLDGTALTELSVDGGGQGCIANDLNGMWLLPQFEQLQLGWEHYQTSIPIDMWVDDVALDTQRIGCN